MVQVQIDDGMMDRLRDKMNSDPLFNFVVMNSRTEYVVSLISDYLKNGSTIERIVQLATSQIKSEVRESKDELLAVLTHYSGGHNSGHAQIPSE